MLNNIYRIVECKYDDGKASYTLQRRFLGLFWRTLFRDKGYYDEVQCFSTLEEAQERLAEYEQEPTKVVSTKYIYKQPL